MAMTSELGRPAQHVPVPMELAQGLHQATPPVDIKQLLESTLVSLASSTTGDKCGTYRPCADVCRPRTPWRAPSTDV